MLSRSNPYHNKDVLHYYAEMCCVLHSLRASLQSECFSACRPNRDGQTDHSLGLNDAEIDDARSKLVFDESAPLLDAPAMSTSYSCTTSLIKFQLTEFNCRLAVD